MLLSVAHDIGQEKDRPEHRMHAGICRPFAEEVLFIDSGVMRRWSVLVNLSKRIRCSVDSQTMPEAVMEKDCIFP